MKRLALFRSLLAVASMFFSSCLLAGNISINSGGTLNGSGDVNADIVVNNGTLSPGQSPGCLNVNNLNSSAGGTFVIDVGGSNACTGYDQLQVAGSVTLGATLNATAYNGYVLNGGEAYTIIDNDGVDAISGTFSGLTEGSLVSIGSKNANISYVGGDGNDVVLTALSDQSINFSAIADQTYDTFTISLSASSTSGLTVMYSSTTSSVCTVSGNTITFVTTGLCSITASQPGNNLYNSAPDVTQHFLINEAFQSINFPAMVDKTFGDASFTVNATASSGLTIVFTSSSSSVCTVSGSTVTLVNTGTCIITASQLGDMNYAIAADITQTFSVNKGSQTITFNTLLDKNLGDTNFTVSATSDSGLPVSFATLTTSVCTVTGSTVAMIDVGVCTITASQPGDANYLAANDSNQSFNVLDATPPVITLNGNSSVTVTKGDSYSDAGASALDNIDGDISGDIVVSGNVDTSVIGVHHLNFDVSDAAGNAAITLIRSVTVADTDADGDGIGDTIDTDDDNDGVDDINDAFPFDPTETIDTDGDGIGNNADTDDDNDGILDHEDSDPLTPHVIDNQAPVIGDVVDITIEATGEFTSVELVTPDVSDNISSSPTILSDSPEAFVLGEHIIIWTATDDAGNSASKRQKVTVVDTTAPEFGVVAAIEVNAEGAATDISAHIDVTAIDLVDGELSAEVAGEQALESGLHEVELTVTDLSGNSALTKVMVSVLPELSIAALKNVDVASKYNIEVLLNGEAPVYPVIISYLLLHNEDVIKQASTSIEQGVNGLALIEIPDDVVVTDALKFVLNDAENAFIGKYNQTILQVAEENLLPTARLWIEQQGIRTPYVDPELGLATITASITDPNASDQHDIEWQVIAGNLVDEQIDNSELTFEIDPGFLAEGLYTLGLTVKEINTEEAHTIWRSKNIVVERLLPLSSALDSDDDAIADSEEGYGDSDNDGIVDYLDNDSVTTRLPIDSEQVHIVTSPGHRLSLGTFVQTSYGSSAQFASLSLEELSGALDDNSASTVLDGYLPLSPVFNFIIEGLVQPGDSAAVVVQLKEALPEGAIYLKYNRLTGWYQFVEDDNNRVSSASLNENNQCPAISDDSYVHGLIAGAHCVQLTLEDGGENDIDLTVNAMIEDPGVIVVDHNNISPTVTLANHSSMVTEGEVLDLSAQGIDENGDELTYYWQQISGVEISFDNTDAQTVKIDIPEVLEDSVIELQVTVSDGELSSIATTRITIKDKVNVESDLASENKGGGVITWLLIFVIVVRCYNKAAKRFSVNPSADA